MKPHQNRIGRIRVADEQREMLDPAALGAEGDDAAARRVGHRQTGVGDDAEPWHGVCCLGIERLRTDAEEDIVPGQRVGLVRRHRDAHRRRQQGGAAEQAQRRDIGRGAVVIEHPEGPLERGRKIARRIGDGANDARRHPWRIGERDHGASLVRDFQHRRPLPRDQDTQRPVLTDRLEIVGLDKLGGEHEMRARLGVDQDRQTPAQIARGAVEDDGLTQMCRDEGTHHALCRLVLVSTGPICHRYGSEQVLPALWDRILGNHGQPIEGRGQDDGQTDSAHR